MRDRKYADVHILITEQKNGSGGEQCLIRFIGQNEFSHLSDTLTYNTSPTQTNDEMRRQQLKYIQLGLMRFFIEKGLTDKISLTFKTNKNLNNTQEDEILKNDPWNYFVYKISAGGWLNGQETSSNFSTNGSFSIKKSNR